MTVSIFSFSGLTEVHYLLPNHHPRDDGDDDSINVLYIKVKKSVNYLLIRGLSMDIQSRQDQG